MVRKIRTCVFISGNGSNLRSIIISSRDYSFPVAIKLIISNKKNAKGLKYAKKYNIPRKFYSFNNKNQFERNCLVDIVCIGYGKKNEIVLGKAENIGDLTILGSLYIDWNHITILPESFSDLTNFALILILHLLQVQSKISR